MINELPYRLRKENIMLVDLWALTEKPNIDLFFEPLIEELKNLHRHGFQFHPPNYDEPLRIKVHTLLSPVDSIQKPCLQNIRQFNGVNGCYGCLSPGEEVPVGRGFTRVYCGDLGPLRSQEQFKNNAIRAVRDKKIINGVNGLSLFLTLPIFNIVLSFPPENVHCVLLGVVKLFITYWFDSKNHDKDLYLGNKRHVFDERMRSIFPPSEITRTPRLSEDLKRLKASELRSILLYYSLSIFQDLLPAVYHRHYTLLVYAITKFNGSKITEAEYRSATNAIRTFVFDVQNLYKEGYMKYNVHLPESVKNFGALWVWSAFPYEDYNHILRKMLFSSRCVVQQICKSYLSYNQSNWIPLLIKMTVMA